MHNRIQRLSICLGLLAAFGLQAATITQYLETPPVGRGVIYGPSARDTNVLYRFERKVERNGQDLKVTRIYTDPAGEVVARELAEYKNGQLASFKLEERQINSESSVQVRSADGHKRLEFRLVKDTTSSAKPVTASESFRDRTVTSDLVVPFIQSHWGELTNGKAIKVRFAAVQRAETVGFTLSKEAERDYHGTPAVVIKMAATSWVIAALVDPIYFVLEKAAPHAILEYRGRTAPKIRVSGKWKDLDGVTVFDR